jgi:hypothetical protein
MDNPWKLATYCTQDEEKQNKNTTQYVLDTTQFYGFLTHPGLFFQLNSATQYD